MVWYHPNANSGVRGAQVLGLVLLLGRGLERGLGLGHGLSLARAVAGWVELSSKQTVLLHDIFA